MFGLRSARSRAILAAAVLVVLLAGVAALAFWRTQYIQEQHYRVEQTAAAATALERVHAQFAWEQAAVLSMLMFPIEPVLVDEYNDAAAATQENLAQARAVALARGKADEVVALENLSGRVADFNEQVDLALPLLLELDAEARVELATATRPEMWSESEAIVADLQAMTDEEQQELADRRAAADRAADTTLWLLIGFSAAAFLVAAGTTGVAAITLARPLTALRGSARAIASGHLEARAKVSGPEEVASLARDFNDMADALLETQEHIGTANLTGDIILKGDKDGRFAFLNEAACQFYGKPREELLGVHYADYVHSEDKEATAQLIREAAETREPAKGFVNRLITPAGTRIVEWNGYPLFGEEDQYFGFQATGRDITERKQAEEALRESEERYRDLVENINEIIYAVDSNGLITYVSPVVERLGGYTPSEIIGRSFTEFIHPDDLAPLMESFQRTVSGNPEPFEYRVLTKSGEAHWVRTSSRPVFEEGRMVGLRAVLMDITDRKRAEEALRENEAKNRALLDAIPDLMFRISKDGTFLDYKADKDSDLLVPPSEFLGSKVREVLPTDVAQRAMHRVKRALQTGGTQVFEYQILLNGEMRDFEARIVASGEDEVLGLVRDITEHKRADEALRENEQAFRLVFENAKDAIFWADPETGLITRCNRAAESLLEKERGEIVGQHQTSLHPPEKAEYYAEMFRRHIEQEGYADDEAEVIAKSGEVVPVHITASVTPVGGKPIIQGVFHDITARKRAEQAVRESEVRFRSLSDSAPIGIFLTDSQGNCTYANPCLLSMAGLTLEESLGYGWTKVIHPDDRQAVLEEVSRAPAEGRDFAREFRLLTAEGRVRSVYVRSTPMVSADGEQIGRVGTLEDITERKQAEKALRESEGRYRLLAENASDVIWTLRLGLRHTYVSPSFTRMRGYSVEEMTGSTVGDTLTPASLDLARKTLAEELAIEKMPQKDLLRSRTLELEIKCKDGSTVWTEAKVAFLRDSDGRAVGILGVSRDISERKKAEENLRESEERLRTLVTNAPVILFAIDREGVFTLSEGKGLEGLGLQPGEVVGRHVLDVFGDSLQVNGYMHRALNGEPLTVTVDLGGLTFETYYRPVRDHDGAFAGGIGVAVDITERMRAQEAVRASEERYRLIAENASDVIWTMDLSLRYTYVSPSVTRMRGYSVEEVMAHTVNESMTPASREVAVKTLAEELAIERSPDKVVPRSRTLELEMYRKDGSTVWCEMNMIFLRDPDGQPVGILGVTRDISERKKAEEEQRRLHAELEVRAITDSLTGLYDHAHFYQRLGEELDRSRRYNQGFAVVMMDVDDFKRFNEARGHHVGDDMLRLVGDCIRSGLRRSDIAFRYGGDEFAAILPHADSSKARAVVNRINRRIAKSLKETDGGPAVRMSLSAGGACFPEDGMTADDLVRVADAALYSAKWVARARDIMGQREDIQSFVSALVSRRAGIEGPLGQTISRPEALHEEQARIVSSVASSIVVALKDAGVTQALEDPDLQIVAVVGAAAEIKDRYIRGHPERTSEQAVALAGQMGLSHEQMRDIRIAGLLHDIGKVSVSESILNKPSKLTKREFATIKDHPVVGATLVSQLRGFEQVVPITRHHHERFDGTGYPDGLAGEDIPLEARILAVADVFDAMTHQRAYRKALSKREAVAELERGAGTQFDPAVVKAFVALVGRGIKEAAPPAEAAR